MMFTNNMGMFSFIKAAAKTIADYVVKMNLTVDGLTIGFDATSSTVIVQGMAAIRKKQKKRFCYAVVMWRALRMCKIN